ncbi:Hypothetical protein NTJ_06585 [Nesidiocoris tenuis]|uniref:Uncharacterized protein n=1 Tax=Nesidiocoris tenuis TaxID=355587 RepID=A0ABN7ANG3_9HEMI|nr:Hypothetical protein NTJ_06585 [Nesidiocoris tenuis]
MLADCQKLPLDGKLVAQQKVPKGQKVGKKWVPTRRHGCQVVVRKPLSILALCRRVPRRSIEVNGRTITEENGPPDLPTGTARWEPGAISSTEKEN